MRLCRHLLASLALVVAVVGLGIAWEHTGATRLIAGGGAPRVRSAVSPPAARLHLHRFNVNHRRERDLVVGGPSWANANNLVHTLVIVTGLSATVVVIDLALRRRRRERRLRRVSYGGR